MKWGHELWAAGKKGQKGRLKQQEKQGSLVLQFYKFKRLAIGITYGATQIIDAGR